MKKLFTVNQSNYLLFRKLNIGSIYILPRWGFVAYANPESNGEYFDTNPFTKSLDAQPVELIELKDDFAKVKFIHSCKGKRPEFWLERFDLEYRGMVESFLLTLVMFIPFSIYNIGVWCKGKFGGISESCKEKD